MQINEISAWPCLYNDAEKGKSHESLLRSFQALKKVLEMIKRGDSKETILEIAALMGYFPDDLCE